MLDRGLNWFGGVVWRMGALAVTCATIIGLGLGGYLLLPSGALTGLLSQFSGWLNPYAPLEPNEYVYDYSLSADVPRLYYVAIPRLGLHAPVVAVTANATQIAGQSVAQLHVPNAFAVGWSASSAPVGRTGNTVLVGHNNEYGEVFRGLWDLQAGDEIILTTAGGDRSYRVTETAMIGELGLGLQARQQNAAWMAPTLDERLTLITCWPYLSNTHRTIVVARPAG